MLVDPTSIGTLNDLSACNNINGNDSGNFDLTANNTNVLNGLNPDDFDVLYYISEQDAIDDNNPISNPESYQNTSNPQIIWAKQDNFESSSCFNLDTFELIVFTPTEITTPPENLSHYCGDFTGTQTFDLTQNDATALGIANPSEVQITYHNTQGDADTGGSPISPADTYQPLNPQEDIFIRAENTNDATCFSTASFSIDIFNVEIFQPLA